jgi:cytochrome c-type biogenesis protein
MGMAFAFAWTPCVGPVLGVVLGLASHNGTLAGGVLLLLAYSLGLALPFVVVGLAFGRCTAALARARHWLWAVELAAGILLVGFGVLLLTDNVVVEISRNSRQREVASAPHARWVCVPEEGVRPCCSLPSTS